MSWTDTERYYEKPTDIFPRMDIPVETTASTEKGTVSYLKEELESELAKLEAELKCLEEAHRWPPSSDEKKHNKHSKYERRMHGRHK